MENETIDNDFINKKSIPFRYHWFYIWLGLYIIGALFKIMHWPFASIMILTGSAGAFAHAISGLFFYKTRNNFTFYFILVGVLYSVRLIYGAVFKNGKPFNYYGLSLFLGVLLVVLLIEFIFLKYKRNKNN